MGSEPAQFTPFITFTDLKPAATAQTLTAMPEQNPGLQPAEIEKIRRQCREKKQSYVLNEDEPQGDEFAHFFFVGKHQGRDCIFDAVMYTLRLHHSSVLYEMAEERAEGQFPRYKRKLDEDEDEEEVDEEIEIFKAEVMDELEESESVKVQEYIHIDTDFDYGYALEVCLNLEEITGADIEKFVRDFTAGTLKLDKTLYTFHHEGDEDDEE